jgi:hypothetical protein
MENDDFRPLSILERRVLHAMIPTELPNGGILIRQIDSSRVRAIDEIGSIEFSVSCDDLYSDVSGPLITAQQEDVDTVLGRGPYINFLLFLRDGVVDELEIYKDDGSRILSTFDPSKFALTWGLPPKK